jgi:hypothetical protein
MAADSGSAYPLEGDGSGMLSGRPSTLLYGAL